MSPTPVHLTGLAAVRAGWQFLRDPIAAMRRSHAELGPFAVISDAVPLPVRTRVPMLGLPLFVTAAPELNEEVLANPTMWRPVAIFPGGPRNSAARRLGAGLARMTGKRHAHYRRLIVPPLRRGNVEALSERMVRLANEEVAAWPIGETVDLWERVRHLLQTFAIGLLFGNDWDRGYPVASLVQQLLTLKWSATARLCPVNLPVTPYGQMLRTGETLERCLLEWSGEKRGHLESNDLLSIVVNNPEEDGAPARDATIVGMMPQLFGALFETCQNVLIWTLVLLAQHPRVAGGVLEELSALGKEATLRDIAELPRLDAALKESLRILPPVPMQARVAQADTTLAGVAAPAGARVLLSALVTNRLPERYPEPDRFLPERWEGFEPTPYQYLVFSAGPRNCPGYWLGTAMLKVAIAAVLLQYRIELSPHEPIDYVARPALMPRGKVAVRLSRQDGKFGAIALRGNLTSLVQFPG
jgi:cytochrome P450